MRLLCHTAASARLHGRLHVEHETAEARPCPDKSPAPRSVHFSAEWTIVSWKIRLLLCQLCGGRYSPFRAPKIEETLDNRSIAEEIVCARPRIVLRDSKSMGMSIQKKSSSRDPDDDDEALSLGRTHSPFSTACCRWQSGRETRLFRT
ncbi:hypothetical protein L1887_49848 [Cichorium endivia]|nr:hypothetical protein L1887_49848 [Cichorium endivia]